MILPGGRAELLEDTRATLRREFLEETGHEAEVEDLLWTDENFSDLEGTTHHELAFVYTVSPTDPAIMNITWIQRTTAGDVDIELL